jgi:predicted dehydrogenase
MDTFTRRNFFRRSALGITAAINAASNSTAAEFLSGSEISLPDIRSNLKPLKKTYRAAAIGFTDHGNFGHGLDRMFLDLPDVEFVALTDLNPEGLKVAGERNGIKRLYTDYNEMFKREKIDVVSVAMRHSIHHEKIVIDCANAGKHIFCEKPIAPDLAATDRMLQACEENGVKIAVATQNRMSPAVHLAKKMVDEGRIGKLLSMRGRGKEDRRGGGEDLMVLGFHILDLMNYFARRPGWVFSHVLQDGREMVKSDAFEGREPNGLFAGDWIASMYGFPGGVHGYFETHRDLAEPNNRFNLELFGSEGIIALRSLKDVVWFKGPVLNPALPHEWLPITVDFWEKIEDEMHWCNQQLVLDLLRAAEEDRQPAASGEDARWALEMISGVYVSHFARKRIPLPLAKRGHPLM